MSRFIKAFKAVGFCMAVVILFSYTYKVFSWKDTGGGYLSSMETFYDLEENTVDVLFLGSSHCFCAVNPAVLWEQHGIAGFSLAISGQDMASSYHCMKEALKTQSPKVVFVEMFYSSLHGYLDKGNLYRNLLGYRLSANFLDAVRSIAEEEEIRDIALKWPVVHTRYAELTKKDFCADRTMETYMGYEGAFHAQYIGEIPVYGGEERLAIGEEEEYWLKEIIRLAEEANVELCFFVAPFYAEEYTQKYYRYVSDLAESCQVPFIDMIQLQNELGIDVYRDFLDWGHMNSYGAGKVTTYLGQFMMERYQLPDRREEQGYDLWEDNLEVWEHQLWNNELTGITDYKSYLEKIGADMRSGESRYTYIVVTKGENPIQTEEMAERLIALGIGEDMFWRQGVWVIEKGSIGYQTAVENCYYHGALGDSNLLLVGREGEIRTVIDRQEYGKVLDGIDIIVYDELLGQLVDVVGFQASEEYSCVR